MSLAHKKALLLVISTAAVTALAAALRQAAKQSDPSEDCSDYSEPR